MEFNFSTSNFSCDNCSSNNNTSDGVQNMTMIPQWCKVVMIVYLFMTSILAICGNCIILLVETNNRFKTSTDWLVSFMACTDILFAVFCIPVHITICMGVWSAIASDALCKIFRFVEYVTAFSSAMLLGTVAIDRYFKTCRPHTQFLTPSRAFRCCTGIMAVACILNASNFAIAIYDGGEECGFQQIAGGIWITTLLSVIIGSYIFMFVTVCFCYIRVAYTMKTKLYEHRLVQFVTDSSTVKENPTTNGKDESRLSKTKPFHKTNRVAPVNNLKAGQLDGQNTDYSSIPECRLFDQSSDNENNGSLNRGNKKSSTSGPPQGSSRIIMAATSPPHVNHRNGVNTRVDRTTKIMFAVTLVFVMSWLPTWGSHFYRSAENNSNVTGYVITFFTRKSYMVNTFMNPIFYIWMSSAFKEKTRKTLRTLISKCGRRQ